MTDRDSSIPTERVTEGGFAGRTSQPYQHFDDSVELSGSEENDETAAIASDSYKEQHSNGTGFIDFAVDEMSSLETEGSDDSEEQRRHPANPLLERISRMLSPTIRQGPDASPRQLQPWEGLPFLASGDTVVHRSHDSRRREPRARHNPRNPLKRSRRPPTEEDEAESVFPKLDDSLRESKRSRLRLVSMLDNNDGTDENAESMIANGGQVALSGEERQPTPEPELISTPLKKSMWLSFKPGKSDFNWADESDDLDEADSRVVAVIRNPTLSTVPSPVPFEGPMRFETESGCVQDLRSKHDMEGLGQWADKPAEEQSRLAELMLDAARAELDFKEDRGYRDEKVYTVWNAAMLRHLKRVINNYKQALSGMQQAMAASQEAWSELKATADRRGHERNQFRAQCVQMKEQLEVGEAEIDRLTESNSKLSSNNESLEREASSLTASLEAKAQEYISCEKQLTAHEACCAKLRAEVEELRKQERRSALFVCTKCASMETQLEDCRVALASARKATSRIAAELQESAEMLRVERAEHKDTRQEYTKVHEKMMRAENSPRWENEIAQAENRDVGKGSKRSTVLFGRNSRLKVTSKEERERERKAWEQSIDEKNGKREEAVKDIRGYGFSRQRAVPLGQLLVV